MTPALVALIHAEPQLAERAEDLRARINGGDETAWSAYLDTLAVLTKVAERLGREDAGRAMTSAELGQRFRLSPRTAAKKAKAGQLPVTALRLGQRGRGALRWRAQA